ncbi:MAG: thiamine protein [Ferruginibacter sp.]|nr:thiamine protein [Ferruginibacter sp.]
MNINILLFGQLTDITGIGTITMEDVADTDSVVQNLHRRFPALATSKYVVAVNKNIITGNTLLTQNSTVALLPPFSGG